MYQEHRAGWISAFKGRRGRRIYIKLNLPTGKIVVWISLRVMLHMMRFLQEEGRIPGLTKAQHKILYAKFKKKEKYYGVDEAARNRARKIEDSPREG